MFAVPGWSVSASYLTTQTNEAIPTQSGPDAGQGEHSARPSRKRKRGKSRQSDVDVTKNNLAELWEKFIEPDRGRKADDTKSKETRRDPAVKASKRAKVAATAAGKWTSAERLPSDAASVSTLKSKKNKPRTSTKQVDKVVPVPEAEHAPASAAPRATSPAAKSREVHLTPLQASMRDKLISARFRHLNQMLYTSPSSNVLETFRQNPEMFDEYHEGFRRQVNQWPENPVDCYIQELERRGMVKGPTRPDKKRAGEQAANGHGADQSAKPLPRTHGLCTIADLGCGEARIAQALQKSKRKLKLEMVSYDLQSPNALVTAADMAALPLADQSVDLAIFCLALMGTNWIDFVEEAYRVLRWKGELWVADIKSRFGRVTGGGGGKKAKDVRNAKRKPKPKSKAQSHDGQGDDKEEEEDGTLSDIDGRAPKREEADFAAFVDVLRRRGFALQSGERPIDASNKMFVRMYFVKALKPSKGKGVGASGTVGERGHRSKPKFLDVVDDVDDVDEASVLKPCVYKTR